MSSNKGEINESCKSYIKGIKMTQYRTKFKLFLTAFHSPLKEIFCGILIFPSVSKKTNIFCCFFVVVRPVGNPYNRSFSLSRSRTVTSSI
jgi:hypothetical protein